MTGAHRSIGGILRILQCIGLLLFVAPIAFAQPAGDVDTAERLPDLVFGRWAPDEPRAWYGDLVINAETLTWEACAQEPYRVVQSQDSAWLIELVNSPACPFPGIFSSPWWLGISRQGDELKLFVQWACTDVNELEKPRWFERECQTGYFSKGAQPADDVFKVTRLQDPIIGTWAPISRGSWQFGELVIDTETLSWGSCVKEPYRVVQSRDAAWLIELVGSPACSFMRVGQTPLLLEISPNGNILDLFLSMCRDISDVNKPQPERQSCSRSRLSRGK